MRDYKAFIESKRHSKAGVGIQVHEECLSDMLFPFQKHIVKWALGLGRAAIFADCGLGKTPMQLEWARVVSEETGGRVLILTPLAVSFQTVREGEKFGIEVKHRREGRKNGDQIVVTNYERLHHFDASDFVGVVCDESSILKNYAGTTRDAITRFMGDKGFRLLCTATPAPNDYIELGTSSEALGYLRRVEMLPMYFVHDGGNTQRWRLKGHAGGEFWRWMTTWARAFRSPSDLGFDGAAFELPPIRYNEHVVKASTPPEEWLFDVPAVTLAQQRDERNRSIGERCELAAFLAQSAPGPSVCWGFLNNECDTLERAIGGAVQVSGADHDDRKESVFRAFSDGEIETLITKPSIGGWGLNWQHCAHQTFFPSHSFEQLYQAVRRSWRFGQRNPVTIDIVASEGERGVLLSIQRKAEQANEMFAALVRAMAEPSGCGGDEIKHVMECEVPAWL